MKKILFFICLMCISSASYSLSIGSYKNMRSDPANEVNSDSLFYYITGIYHGVRITRLFNEVITETHDVPTILLIYCVPEGLKLNYENLLQIIDDELEQEDYTDDLVLAHPLIAGLKRTFPCE